MELDGKVTLNDSFNYQIDIVAPDAEKIFDKIRKDIFDEHFYYLVRNLKLSKLLTKQFSESFLKNGSLYLMSYDTKLDCHDCVCLLPNGHLILNLTKSTSQKIPAETTKRTVKSTGYEKYEIEISIGSVIEDEKKADKLRDVFESMSFSFFTFWRPNHDRGPKNDLEQFFGEQSVLTCLNRIDSRIVDCAESALDQILKTDLTVADNWIDVENLIGCLIHNIDLKKLLPNDASLGDQASKVSILRVKSFMPNSFIKTILEDYRDTLMDEEDEFSRVFIKIHGFKDSPVGLIKLNDSNRVRSRETEENFLSICLEQSKDKRKTFYFLRDFRNFYSIKS